MRVNFTFFYIFFALNTFAQQNKNDTATNNKLALTLAFINIQPTDSIVDIGSGSGYSIIPIVAQYPNILFTLQDIDSNTLNIKNIERRLKKISKENNIAKLNIVYGTENNTNVPKASFNKILLFDVVHEFKYKAAMLNEIAMLLTPNGSLFIEEIIVHNPQKKDRACAYPFFTEVAFKKLMLDNSFVLVKEQITLDSGRNKYKKLYHFKIK